MEYTKYIIAVIIGASIGYITNWLAIKMLFRPHMERRILGVKVPFTPGLMPKERYRIARSIGDTIGEHLLSKETLVEALSNDRMKLHIKGWIVEKVREFKNNGKSLEEISLNVLGEGYSNFLQRANEKVSCKIKKMLIASETREKLRSITKDALKKILSEDPKSFTRSAYMIKIKDFSYDKIKTLKDSESFKEKIKIYIEEKTNSFENSDKSLEEVMPEGILPSVKVYLYSSRKDICDAIQNMLKQPTVSERLKSAIASMVSNNFNPIVAAFIKVDSVYQKLIVAVEEYFKEDENQRNIIMLINEGIDKLSKDKISKLYNRISVEDREMIAEALTNLIIGKVLTDEFINKTSAEIENSLNKYASVDELLCSIDGGYLDTAVEFILNKIYIVLETQSFDNIVGAVVERTFREVLKATPANIIGENEEALISVVMNGWEKIFDRFLANDALTIVEAMNIPKIVEDRINSFDVSFAENIIISIADKELKAITWLGALLGGIMGILSPILGSLY